VNRLGAPTDFGFVVDGLLAPGFLRVAFDRDDVANAHHTLHIEVFPLVAQFHKSPPNSLKAHGNLFSKRIIVMAIRFDIPDSRQAGNHKSAKRPERGSHFFREELPLLPRCEVPAFLELAVTDEFRVRALSPTPESRIDFIGKAHHGDRNRDLGAAPEGRLLQEIADALGRPKQRLNFADADSYSLAHARSKIAGRSRAATLAICERRTWRFTART
jgi:hypothetical protein